jgi:hypothetical protein
LNATPPKPLWERLAEHGALLFAVGGVLIYGILVLAYSEFFQELGISPADVGIEYGKTIGGAAGLTLVAAFAVLLLSFPAIGLAEVIRRGLGDPNWWPGRSVVWGGAVVLVAVLTLLYLLVKLHNVADDYADRIKKGQRIEPYRLGIPLFDLELLAVRGEPATVEPAKPAVAKLLGSETMKGWQRQFYVGQAKGVAVLYDARRQRVLYVPTAGSLVTTVNCETKRAEKDPVCERAETPIRQQ